MGDSLGDRMKVYERVPDTRLIPRMPVIIRVDGKAFHTLTRGMDRPWDLRLVRAMQKVARDLCKDIHGAQLAYVQSDEVSLLLTDWDRFGTQSWMGYRIQKMASLAGAMATESFGRHFREEFAGSKFEGRKPLFDARVSSYPRHEVVNYFLWRQQDATRNSIQMLARAHFSHKQCHQKNGSQLQDMLHEEHGINWNDIPTHLKRGTCVYKTEDPEDSERTTWNIDEKPPIFSQEREFIDRYLTEPFWKEQGKED